MKRRLLAGMFEGQKVLVVGLGVHGGGTATVRWLQRHGARVRISDRRTRTALMASIKQLPGKSLSWSLGGEKIADVRWADWLVQNPGVPETNSLIVAAKKFRKPIHNEAGLFLRYAPGRVIGVTGTRGKTTTTLLIAHILKKFHPRTIAAGNLRDLPVLAAIDRLTPRHWSVVELSSFQLEGLPAVRRSPHIAVWTNLLVDHLNRYATLGEYAAAKSNILRYQRSSDVAVLNADSAVVRRMAKYTSASICWYGRKRPTGGWTVFIQDGWVVERRRGTLIKIVQLRTFPLAGEHQHHNVLAAVATCRAAGVPVALIRRAVRTFPSVPHRQQVVRTWRGHRWINDTTATSPDGALAAIAAFPGAVYILGGTDKNLDFKTLARVIAKMPDTCIFLPGTATEKIVSRLRRYGVRQPVVVGSMAEAVQQAATLAQPKQDIVLTPGAASFGLFRHEFDRGEQFIRFVKKLR